MQTSLVASPCFYISLCPELIWLRMQAISRGAFHNYCHLHGLQELTPSPRSKEGSAAGIRLEEWPELFVRPLGCGLELSMTSRLMGKAHTTYQSSGNHSDKQQAFKRLLALAGI